MVGFNVDYCLKKQILLVYSRSEFLVYFLSAKLPENNTGIGWKLKAFSFQPCGKKINCGSFWIRSPIRPLIPIYLRNQRGYWPDHWRFNRRCEPEQKSCCGLIKLLIDWNRLATTYNITEMHWLSPVAFAVYIDFPEDFNLDYMYCFELQFSFNEALLKWQVYSDVDRKIG